MTTSWLEEDVSARFEPLIAFDQFAAHHVELFTSIVVLIDVRPFTPR